LQVLIRVTQIIDIIKLSFKVLTVTFHWFNNFFYLLVWNSNILDHSPLRKIQCVKSILIAQTCGRNICNHDSLRIPSQRILQQKSQLWISEVVEAVFTSLNIYKRVNHTAKNGKRLIDLAAHFVLFLISFLALSFTASQINQVKLWTQNLNFLTILWLAALDVDRKNAMTSWTCFISEHTGLSYLTIVGSFDQICNAFVGVPTDFLRKTINYESLISDYQVVFGCIELFN